jgi:hypothetical protein
MGEERELLRRAIDIFEKHMDVNSSVHDRAFGETLEEIRAYLATEKEAEPVFIRPDHLALARKSPFLCRVEPKQRDDFIPLYLHPPRSEPARKPMTEEPVAEAFVLPFKGDEAKRRVEIEWKGEPVAGLLYAHPPKQKKPITVDAEDAEDAEDEAFNSASKYAAWLETENRMLREARKPMTEAELDVWMAKDCLDDWDVRMYKWGFRDAEKHHGIGTEK